MKNGPQNVHRGLGSSIFLDLILALEDLVAQIQTSLDLRRGPTTRFVSIFLDLGEAGRGGAVGFVPFQERVEAVYRALDVVVHASTRPEPFGLTIAEGMAGGGR